MTVDGPSASAAAGSVHDASPVALVEALQCAPQAVTVTSWPSSRADVASTGSSSCAATVAVETSSVGFVLIVSDDVRGPTVTVAVSIATPLSASVTVSCAVYVPGSA